MDDFKHQLLRHYQGQQLPADRVQEILTAGREAAAARASRAWWRMAVAAGIILGLGIFGASTYFRGRIGPLGTPRIATTEVARAVVSYFSDPNYQLSQVSADRGVLVEWLRLHGGPSTFQVPPALARLSSYGCQVLNVQGQNVYLICFLLDTPLANTPPGAMPAKKMMITVGPAGQMMKKSVPLVHLMVAPKAGFIDPPKPGERIVLPATGEWNFTTWTQGDQVYVAAAAMPAERLSSLVAAL